MKNTQHTELVFILDRSGSMDGMEEQAVKSFNSFLNDQKNIDGSANLTLVLFDNVIETPIKFQNIQKVDEISATDFNPRATTALLDAIGKSIKEVDVIIKKSKDNNINVIFAIFTDGYENDSVEYSWRHVSELISNRKEKNWKFLFLACLFEHLL